jgi:hypothetical protein
MLRTNVTFHRIKKLKFTNALFIATINFASPSLSILQGTSWFHGCFGGFQNQAEFEHVVTVPGLGMAASITVTTCGPLRVA